MHTACVVAHVWFELQTMIDDETIGAQKRNSLAQTLNIIAAMTVLYVIVIVCDELFTAPVE